MKPDPEIAIGELSRQTKCNIETIRYYERIGLLPTPRRNAGRFRRYDADDVGRLRFIRRARQLGFTLDEVRALMRLPTAESGDVRQEARGLAEAHLKQIRAKIADLQAMERILASAIRECAAGEPPACPIVAVFSGDSPPARLRLRARRRLRHPKRSPRPRQARWAAWVGWAR